MWQVHRVKVLHLYLTNMHSPIKLHLWSQQPCPSYAETVPRPLVTHISVLLCSRSLKCNNINHAFFIIWIITYKCCIYVFFIHKHSKIHITLHMQTFNYWVVFLFMRVVYIAHLSWTFLFDSRFWVLYTKLL